MQNLHLVARYGMSDKQNGHDFVRDAVESIIMFVRLSQRMTKNTAMAARVKLIIVFKNDPTFIVIACADCASARVL